MRRRTTRAGAIPVLLLLIVATAGCLDTGDSGDDEGEGPLPHARMTVSPVHADRGQTVRFDASGSNGTGLEYAWDFGDGQGGTGEKTTYAYAEVGPYTVKLTVKDKWGRRDSDSAIVKVNYREEAGGTLEVGSGDDSWEVPVQEDAAGFKLTLTYPSGQFVAGRPQNDLDLVLVSPDGEEVWSSSREEPDDGDLQEETVEVTQQMLAENFWEDWSATVTLSTGVSVEYELEIFVSY